jgi:1,2-diacylglycerol 3-alpha-glucosyltransferase
MKAETRNIAGLRVVMLCEFYDESLEYQENLLVKYYRKFGVEVTVITSTLDSVFDYYSDKHELDKPTREYQHLGAKIIKLKYRYIRFMNRLRRYEDITPILIREKPDLIFVHDIMLNLPEVVAYQKKNPATKIILDYHADYSNSGKNLLSLWVLHRLIRRCFFLSPARKYISKIFPIVPAGFTFLREVYGVSDAEMELLPLGADTDFAEEVREKKLGITIRAGLKIRRDDFVIFTGGKLNDSKKTHLLVQALNNLSFPNVHLIVVGKAQTPEYNQEITNLVAGNKQMHFVGWLNKEQVYAHLNASDIAIFPASQSVLWQQAICMHLPLVVGDIGGQSIAYLNEEQNVIEVPAADITVETFMQIITDLVNNSAKRQAMSLGAEKVTSDQLDWNQMVYKTLAYN